MLDQQTLNALTELVRSLMPAKQTVDWLGVLSILSPIATGGILAVIGYKLDQRRKAQIAAIDQKIEQELHIDKSSINLAFENKKIAMQKAVALWELLYQVFREILTPESRREAIEKLEKAWNQFWPTSLFFSPSLQNEFLQTLMAMNQAKFHADTPTFGERFVRIEERIPALQLALKKEFNLTGDVIIRKDVESRP